MSANPYKIWDKVSGDIFLEKISTEIKDFDKDDLYWNADKETGIEYLTLNEIYEQIKKFYIENYQDLNKYIRGNFVPFIRVTHETGLWGVIFEIGNYGKEEWIVHGITKGYA